MHWESLVSKAHLIYAVRVYISEQKQKLIPINYLLKWRLLKYISRKFTDLLILVHLIWSFVNGIFSRWIAVFFFFYMHHTQFKCHFIKSCLWAKHLKINVNCPRHFSSLPVLRLFPEIKDLMDFCFVCITGFHSMHVTNEKHELEWPLHFENQKALDLFKLCLHRNDFTHQWNAAASGLEDSL